MTRTPLRPGNDLPDRSDWMDAFEKTFLTVVFTISGAAFLGLITGLIIGAIR